MEIGEPSGGERAFAPMNDFLQDAAAKDISDRGRVGAQNLPTEWTQCSVKRSDATQASDVDDTYSSLLEFRQGRLAAIWLGRPPRDAALARSLQADDGAGFPSDGGLSALPSDVHLTVACSRYIAEPIQPPSHAKASYNWPQALAALPLVPALPFKNAHRTAAKRDGEALYDTLIPGSTPPAAVAELTRGKGLVEPTPTSAPGLILLRVDLGASPGRNLTAPDDYGLIGIRQWRVVWRVRGLAGW